ncbi:DUF3800 domain-containing protein [Aliarcobacter lanthieri]|uniref:DUF3800 domain-containing protein n=1 Tax=Aliarcobacter lanthieri TaxID=1355374 RepID=UPI003AFA12F8
MKKQFDYKIFCDESNHLESDKSDIMVIGGISCDSSQVEYMNRYIKYLKNKHNAKNELKWTKLNNNKKEFYTELFEFFFSRVDMRFNAQVVLNKSNLNHDKFNDGEADKFYYKMYYYVLVAFLKPNKTYNVFMDFKDTQGSSRVLKLKEIIQNKFYEQLNTTYTIINSKESQIMQLCDLFIGAISYKNRVDIEKTSEIKNFIISELERFSSFPLDGSAPEWEKKFRIFRFRPRKLNV